MQIRTPVGPILSRVFQSPNQQMIRHFVVAFVLTACSIGFAHSDDRGMMRQRGEALAKKMCANCHAIDHTDESPHPGAPPFRSLDRRVDLDSFIERLNEGLTSGHPDMPTFRFSRQDARAFIAYLRSIQRGP
jgi:cytochrome c